MNCEFLTRSSILNVALIFDAVDHDFADDDPIPETQINISGGDFRDAIVNAASTLNNVQQSIDANSSLEEDTKAQ